MIFCIMDNKTINRITILRRTIKHKRLPRKLKKLLRKFKWIEGKPIYLGDMSNGNNKSIDLSKPIF